ncbi:MAG: tRNA (adenosine(37)-N6)-threonylcarbamoyltransferase complex dimerization subunit type 1 TsaB [Bacteroidia bacterium]
MTYILHIESATKNCSVAISKDAELIGCIEETPEGYEHSEKLSVFIDKAIRQVGITYQDLSAIAVSKGPGSYTGLRIGVSTAKGLCYALDIPLISIPTTDVLAKSYSKKLTENDIICAMIDARRMEVYCAFYNHLLQPISDIKAIVVDEHFAKEYSEKHIHFMGDVASKIKGTIAVKNHTIENIYPSSKSMIESVLKKYTQQQFEDVAYFEPFYLKEFFTPF